MSSEELWKGFSRRADWSDLYFQGLSLATGRRMGWKMTLAVEVKAQVGGFISIATGAHSLTPSLQKHLLSYSVPGLVLGAG